MRLRILTAVAVVTVLGATIVQTTPILQPGLATSAPDANPRRPVTTPIPNAMSTSTVPRTTSSPSPTPTTGPSPSTPATTGPIGARTSAAPARTPAVDGRPTGVAPDPGAPMSSGSVEAPPVPPVSGVDAGAAAAAPAGAVRTGVATHYDADGGGNCSYDPGGDLAIAAMNQTDYQGSRACGGHIRVTGPSGSTVVKVVDRCPECPPGAVDLSPQAFARIAPLVAGKVEVTWTEVDDPTPEPVVRFRYKEGSTEFWCALQVLDANRTIEAVWLDDTRLQRQEYNYFTSEGGDGCGGRITVEDTRGSTITTEGIAVLPLVVQAGGSQFP